MLIYILFILGFIILIKGADLLVEGSSSIAKRFGVSDLVIGLTIVSFGTSAPELFVNLKASLEGAGDLVIGNILGSNISNILLILGISAMIYPLAVKRETTWKGIPLNFLAAMCIFVMANDAWIDGAATSVLSRADGIMLMFFFIIFVYYTVGIAKKENNNEKINPKSIWIALAMTLLGILGLTYGGKWVVNGAIQIAQVFGLSQSLIGLTIVAIGTSLPELATSAVAAYKKNTDIAVGNVVGSNIFNVFWVLGLSIFIKPVAFPTYINTDLFVFMAATLLLLPFIFIGKRGTLQRWQGAFFVLAYVAYVAFLVIRG